jgi:hypothetical protein
MRPYEVKTDLGFTLRGTESGSYKISAVAGFKIGRVSVDGEFGIKFDVVDQKGSIVGNYAVGGYQKASNIEGSIKQKYEFNHNLVGFEGTTVQEFEISAGPNPLPGRFGIEFYAKNERKVIYDNNRNEFFVDPSSSGGENAFGAKFSIGGTLKKFEIGLSGGVEFEIPTGGIDRNTHYWYESGELRSTEYFYRGQTNKVLITKYDVDGNSVDRTIGEIPTRAAHELVVMREVGHSTIRSGILL